MNNWISFLHFNFSLSLAYIFIPKTFVLSINSLLQIEEMNRRKICYFLFFVWYFMNRIQIFIKFFVYRRNKFLFSNENWKMALWKGKVVHVRIAALQKFFLITIFSSFVVTKKFHLSTLVINFCVPFIAASIPLM